MIIAHAALLRLGYQDWIDQMIPFDILTPHPLQGRLAIQVCADDQEMVTLFENVGTGHCACPCTE